LTFSYKENATKHDRGSRANMTTWRGIHLINFSPSSYFTCLQSSLFSNISFLLHAATELPFLQLHRSKSRRERHRMILSSGFRRPHCNTTAGEWWWWCLMQSGKKGSGKQLWFVAWHLIWRLFQFFSVTFV
jgi:hypothetical protein